MRKTLLALVAALCLVSTGLLGCGDDATSRSDLSTHADLSAQADQSSTGENCLQVTTCAASCASTACQQACFAKGSPAAQQEVLALQTCAVSLCLGHDGGTNVDGGAGSCTSSSDESSACQACITTEAEGPGCKTEFNACFG